MTPGSLEIGGVGTLADAKAADQHAEPALAVRLGGGVPVAALWAVGAGAAVRGARLAVEPDPFERSLVGQEGGIVVAAVWPRCGRVVLAAREREGVCTFVGALEVGGSRSQTGRHSAR